MTILTSPPPDPKAHWITPNEQLRQLAFPEVERRTEVSRLIPDLTDIVASYVLDPKLTTWCTSLKLIKRLPKKIPPLPRDIHQILNSPCPRKICSKKKPDGTFYTVGEKCTLTLVPEELGTINAFERDVRAYGEKQYPENENPLQFCYFMDDYRAVHENVLFGPTYWQLHTDSILERSRDKTYVTQAALVDDLARETLVDWQVPGLRDTIATIFLHKIGTGESLFQIENDQDEEVHTYTRVKETARHYRLMIGSYAPSGVNVNYCPDIYDERIGVAARLKL